MHELSYTNSSDHLGFFSESLLELPHLLLGFLGSGMRSDCGQLRVSIVSVPEIVGTSKRYLTRGFSALFCHRLQGHKHFELPDVR